MEDQKERKGLLSLGAIALLLGIAFTQLFFGQGFGLNVPIFIGLVLMGVLILNRIFYRVFERSILFLIILIAFFAVMVFVRSSSLLTFFNILGCVLLLLILVGSYAGKHLKEYLPGNYMKVFLLPVEFLRPFSNTFADMIRLGRRGRELSKSREIIRGIAMAISALAIFTALFASADTIFGEFIKNIFSFNFTIEPKLVQRLIIFAAASVFFIGAFSYMFRKLHLEHSASTVTPRTLGAIETNILLGSINTLFFAFIILQITYLFGGQAHLAAQGLTYAEYARKGFYELVLVAILSYIIISLAEKQIIKKDESHLGSFKFFSTVLVIEVVAILISAFARLSLYESAYGFSTIRLYSHALMIWIAIILVLLLHHILTNGARTVFARRAFACVVLLLITMNIINPDAFIAKRNIERYYATGEIDTEYLTSLSDDTIPYSIILLDDSNEKIRTEFASSLYWSRAHNAWNWQSIHLSSLIAEKMLAPQKAFLEKNQGNPPAIDPSF